MKFDVAIVGSGLAGLSVALNLASTRRVALIAKRSMMEGASDNAQGGIAAVLDSADSIENHVDDTLVAGGGLCDEGATRYIVEHGREAIEWLISQGVPFTKDDAAGSASTLRVKAACHRRIIHAADATGHAVLATLSARARQHPNITFFENHHAIDLITSDRLGLPGRRCHGLYALDVDNDRTIAIEAPHTVLATGGAGKVYLYTTNPDTATGDGIAMAWRAGCRVSNMEFIQFHPTCLFHPYAKSFLISEAVRGEGGLLKLPDGTRFMPAHDPRAELAPRDIVARAIDFEIRSAGSTACISTSATSRKRSCANTSRRSTRAASNSASTSRKSRFPSCRPHTTRAAASSPTSPGAPISRACMRSAKRRTRAHGANRLASNSLLECLIGRAAAEAIEAAGFDAETPATLPAWDESRVSDADEEVVVAHNWDELRRLMWNYVGIVRTDKRLERAKHRLSLLRDEIQEYYANFRVTRDLLELRNLVDVATLIVKSAHSRRESRGLHYSRDWPNSLPKALPSVLTPRARR